MFQTGGPVPICNTTPYPDRPHLIEYGLPDRISEFPYGLKVHTHQPTLEYSPPCPDAV